MKQTTNTIQYFLYARKSSEAEDKQVASIDAQIAEMKKLSGDGKLKVVEIFTESQSAKAPGRPIFNKMLERIHNGEAQGILCWKLDRLARNPIDGGNISWMLQQGIIKHIQTYGRSYYPTDNVLMMSVEFGMANQFIRDLSEGVKRGLRAKAEKGCYPTVAPIGYLNNPLKIKGEKDIMTDPERFPVLRKMFNELLSGKYTPPQIWETMVKEWKFKMRDDKPLSRSTFYHIITEPFYYGWFEYPKGSGNWFKGTHDPIITEEEFDEIQVILGRKGKPRPKTHIFAFTGLIRCQECGASITAEEKVKRPKNGKVHRYVYYHCTKRINPNCTQGSIEEGLLKKQIKQTIESLKIPPEFHEWAMKWFRSENEKEGTARNAILASQQKAYNECLKKLDGLLDMRAAKEISEEEFAAKKSTLVKEKTRLEELLADTGQRANRWLEVADELFIFTRDALAKFENGTFEIKRQIFSALGSNRLLFEKMLSIDLENSLLPIPAIASEVKAIHERLEPLKTPMDKMKIERLYARSPVLLPGLDSNQEPSR